MRNVARGISDRALAAAIRGELSPDLLRPRYRGGVSPVAGHCYVASEAFYWLRGGPVSRYQPMHQLHEGVSHWWLRSPQGSVVDITAAQFATPVDYSQATHMAFLSNGGTPQPSLRARVLMARVARRLRSPEREVA